MHETVAPLDAPTPEQLFRLAGKSAVLAKEQERMKAKRAAAEEYGSRTHFMMPKAEVIIPDILEAPLGFRFEEKYAGRIARTDHRAWSLRLVHVYAVTEMGSQRGVERHTYSFNWNHAETTLARHTLVIPPEPELDWYDQINRFTLDSNIPDEWSWRMQLEEVTAGDVEILTSDIERFTVS